MLRNICFWGPFCVQCVPWSLLQGITLFLAGGKHEPCSFSQSQLFFQLQMAAGYEGHHFQGTHLQNACEGSATFGITPTPSRLQGTSVNVALFISTEKGMLLTAYARR